MSDSEEIVKYLKNFHADNINEVRNGAILEDDIKNYSILVDLKNLQSVQPKLFERVLANCHLESEKWSNLFHDLQLTEGSFRSSGKIHTEKYKVRFFNAPLESDDFPSFNTVCQKQFLTFRAKIVRAMCPKFIDIKRELYCSKCRNKIMQEAKYEYSFVFEKLWKCPTNFCKGTPHEKADEGDVNIENCMKYQEMVVDPQMKSLNFVGNLTVTLEADLCDIVKPGDSVVICGTAEMLWKPNDTDVRFVIRANSILCEDFKPRSKLSIEEHSILVRSEWEEFRGLHSELELRDEIIASIAPKLKGMYPLKLAIALVLASVTNKGEAGKASFTRRNSHLLLVGDPGLGKSQLIQSAAEIAARSVHTTGMGSTKAGLTAAAVRENGDWHLEAGALVLADGGICCIDEFNLMRNTDNVSIHEAMEQQTISVSKAGIVCKLNSRCSIVAGMNPKNPTKGGYSSIDFRGLTFDEIGLSPALISRFDLIFVLEQEYDVEWDMEVADHVFEESKKQKSGELDTNLWDLEKLQAHFLVSQNTDVTISKDANRILCHYYSLYRQSATRDPSRTSARFLESMRRLTAAHAKLLLRSEAGILDAITVIRLMESSFGFDQMKIKFDLVKEILPLGPTKDQMLFILDHLQLFDLMSKVEEDRPIGELSARSKKTQASAPDSFGDLFNINRVDDDSDEENIPKSGDLSFGGFSRSVEITSTHPNMDSGEPPAKKPAKKYNWEDDELNVGDTFMEEYNRIMADFSAQEEKEASEKAEKAKAAQRSVTEPTITTTTTTENVETNVQKSNSKYDKFIPKPRTWNQVCSEIPAGTLRQEKNTWNTPKNPAPKSRKPSKIDEIFGNNGGVVIQQAPSYNDTALQNLEALKNYYGSDGSNTFSQCMRDVQGTTEQPIDRDGDDMVVDQENLEPSQSAQNSQENQQSSENSGKENSSDSDDEDNNKSPVKQPRKVSESTLAKLSRFNYVESTAEDEAPKETEDSKKKSQLEEDLDFDIDWDDYEGYNQKFEALINNFS